MNRIGLYFVVSSLVLGSPLGSAYGDPPTALPDTRNPIAFRMYLMENIGDNAKELKAKIDAGRFGESKVNAQAIALHSTRIPELFPEGSISEPSRAKDEIWRQWGKFYQFAQTLGQEADQLAHAVADGQVDRVSGQFTRIADTCKGCHDSFRQPD